MPPKNIKGSGIITVDYTANGEASDWMLFERGVYAMSPELGSSSLNSQDFFISNPSDL
jgi:hypothetical protein